jgi:hypothetical protein
MKTVLSPCWRQPRTGPADRRPAHWAVRGHASPQQAACGGRQAAGPPLPYFEAGAGVDVLGAEVELPEVLGAGADAAGAGAGAGLAGAGVEVLGIGFAAVCTAAG